jgi:hypothetical protein
MDFAHLTKLVEILSGPKTWTSLAFIAVAVFSIVSLAVFIIFGLPALIAAACDRFRRKLERRRRRQRRHSQRVQT